jgi:hypothetical protein
MSKLTRALAVAAIVAAMHPVALSAAQAQPASHDASAAQAAADTAHRRLLAQEQSLTPTRHDTLRPPSERQVGEYWRHGPVSSQASSGQDASPMPAKPSGQASWVTPALGALAAVLALVAGVAVLVVRRANRGQRAGQTA